MQVLCPRCEDDERDGYSMCTRCGQHFPLVKLAEEPLRPPITVDAAPCEECDRETFFGRRECGFCGRTLRRDPVPYR
jgi:hypothetical protein